ncbi:LysR family transcriptional regulator [Sphingobacterium sp. lm-10]|uniref:winged helix-turn-helix domain-containing protein n=1 Tax=Sphingobacterium sp. lm-10 TaxID=2944904 RepID=UPI002021D5A7|nr:LysR family transcriptional regulator [Sphingobacterium sp. lm-10]MCL7989064.1 LysR family transcriptional regulator [Sphingobacterium sp. lm-10]
MKQTISNLLNPDVDPSISGRIWITSASGTPFFGPGPMELLERIADTGSISKAALEMKMSYRKAWGLINNLNQHTCKPVIIPRIGGESGGGSILTEEALNLISAYKGLQSRFRAFLELESSNI